MHEVHYLVQLDESSSTGNAAQGGADHDASELGQVEYDRDNDQAREELNRLRLSLLQLSLAASVTAELEDLRSDEEKHTDHVVFGPHDPLLGPADMDREAEKDAFLLTGCLDHTGFVVETAPDVGFFSKEYIEAHPKTMFVYADMAAPDEGVKQVHAQSLGAVVDTLVRTKFLQLYSGQGTVQAYRAYKNRPSPKLTWLSFLDLVLNLIQITHTST
eukprot:SAG11_NODE_2578_length_3200_cov_2.960013_2_plen_216_part_00